MVDRLIWLFVLCVCASSIAKGPGSECLHVNTSTLRIVDTDGRERYFHGVNVVVKGPPWLPELETFDPLKSFVEKDMQTLQDLGLNAIRYNSDTCILFQSENLMYDFCRYGMMWPGAEPKKDVYNETYFTLSKNLINA